MSGGEPDRIEALEVRVAYQDQTIEELNTALAEQWRTIEQLERRIARFEAELQEATASVRDIVADEPPPPHY